MPLKNNTKFCGAKARQNNHQPCMQPSIRGKLRCRLHGGLSTGAKTPEGKIKSAKANLKDGCYTKEAIAEKQNMRMMMNWRSELKDI